MTKLKRISNNTKIERYRELLQDKLYILNKKHSKETDIKKKEDIELSILHLELMQKLIEMHHNELNPVSGFIEASELYSFNTHIQYSKDGFQWEMTGFTDTTELRKKNININDVARHFKKVNP